MAPVANYQDLMGRISLYVDNELDKNQERELLLTLRNNPEYQTMLQKEQLFKEFMKKRLQRRKVSPALVHSIKQKIRE